jgi:hypothetical protein
VEGQVRRHGGLGYPQAQGLEEENSKLKRMFANLSLENEALKDVIAKKALRPARSASLADFMHSEHGLSETAGMCALGLSRTVYRYEPKPRDDSPIIEALLGLADRYPRYGFGKLFAVLRRHGFRWNHKRVYRVYCLLKMNLRRKGKKRLPSRTRNHWRFRHARMSAGPLTSCMTPGQRSEV